LIDDSVGSDDPTVKTRTVREDSCNTNPMCFCSKALCQGRNTHQSDQLLPVQQSKGDQMDESGVEGLDETHFLAPVLKLNNESDTPPLAPGKTEGPAKKWLLQEDGSYKPVFYKKAGRPFVSSMTHLSSDKPGRGVAQTWCIIAIAIKQQEQLNESHFAKESHFATTDNSQVAIDINKTQGTISAFNKT
jgi:hypothetical protein